MAPVDGTQQLATVPHQMTARRLPSRRSNQEVVQVDGFETFVTGWLRGELPSTANAYQWVLALREHDVASLDDFTFMKQVAHALAVPFIKTPLRMNTTTFETTLQFYLADANSSPLSTTKICILENSVETELASSDITYNLISASKFKFFKVKYSLVVTHNPEGHLFLRADAIKVIMSSTPLTSYNLNGCVAPKKQDVQVSCSPLRLQLKYLPAHWIRVIDSSGNAHLLNKITNESVPEIIESCQTERAQFARTEVLF